ncbi:MAG: hypothetical protein QHH02_04465 [Syntrophomonadaceae bacterium]|nr:hypothetical protein [Syntrophomonadaceae bacterium]
MERRSGYPPENAEMCFKCSQCGNMYPITRPDNRCEVCGNRMMAVPRSLAIGASNEDY